MTTKLLAEQYDIANNAFDASTNQPYPFETHAITIGDSVKPFRMAIAGLALPVVPAATPARAQSDARAIVATVTKFLDGIRARDTSLMRSAVVSGATFMRVGGWKIRQIAATSRTDGCRAIAK